MNAACMEQGEVPNEDQSLVAERIQKHLRASQNISLLQEFCQGAGLQLPTYTATSAPIPGSYPQQFSHGMRLVTHGKVWECRNASSKAEAKKLVAAAALDYFERCGETFFQSRTCFAQLLGMLTQALGLPDPVYEPVMIAPLQKCRLIVGEEVFDSDRLFGKKSAAKEHGNLMNAMATI